MQMFCSSTPNNLKQYFQTSPFVDLLMISVRVITRGYALKHFEVFPVDLWNCSEIRENVVYFELRAG